MNIQTQPETVPQIFEPAYYQRLYDIEEKHWWAQGMREAMVALLDQPLKDKQALRVLDAGCGTGYLLDFLKQHYSLAEEPVGIDVSSHALQFCQLRGAKAVMLASVIEIPFEDASFDLIICIDTIQHLSPAGADQVAIAELARLLKPGGVLYLRTNSALGHPPLVGADPDQYRRYYCQTVCRMLSQAGLIVKRATYLNAIPSIPAMLKEYLHTYLRPQTHKTAAIGPGLAIQPPAPRPSISSHLMHGVLKLESWLLRKNFNLPFGHSSGYIAQKPL